MHFNNILHSASNTRQLAMIWKVSIFKSIFCYPVNSRKYRMLSLGDSESRETYRCSSLFEPKDVIEN